MIRDIRYGIKNLFLWFKIIWFDRNWDYVYLLIILERKLDYMEKYQRDYGISADYMNLAKQLMVCKNLCRRIREDTYDNAGIRWSPDFGKRKQYDVEFLCDNIKKRLLDWWD